MFAFNHWRCIPTVAYLAIWGVAAPLFAASTTLTGQTMGTSYTIKVATDHPVDRETLEARIQHRLGEIDQRMSTYRNDSDVTQFNHAPSGEWFPVHAETAFVVELAQSIARDTEGAFDVTVGPAVRLWNFGAEASGEFQLPSQAEIEAAQQRVGYEMLRVRLDPPALQKSVDGLQIDLSGIAKGHAVDAVAQVLIENGLAGFMVEIGGEVRVQGANPSAGPWRIGIEAPVVDDRRVDSVVALTNQSMATSGSYRSFFQFEGNHYSHTIDPRSCRPVAHPLAAATVVGDTCARADALATALLVMGPKRGLSWAESNGVGALLMAQSDAGLRRQPSSSFPAITATAGEPAAGAGHQFGRLFSISLIVFGIAVLAMSLGTIIANRRLQGSCGGMAGLKDQRGNTLCDLCVKPAPDCDGRPNDEASSY